MKKMLHYAALILVCLLISACGKKGPVESLEPSHYPRNYPKLPEPDPIPSDKSKESAS